MQRGSLVVLFCLIGVAINTWLACSLLLPGAWAGKNDFAQLYAGARLAGSADLYNREAVHEVELKEAGRGGPSLRYSRLPYYALLLKPLGWLPYRAAYAVWLGLSFAALAGFAALWHGGAKTWLACCWFLPAFVAVFNGQDAGMLLLWTALAVALANRDRQFAAGAILGLCASKYHLAVLLPLVIVAQRRWRMASGFATVATAMILISFGVAGLRWPALYYDVLADPLLHPNPAIMPSLHGLQLGTAWEMLLTGLLAICVLVAARNASLRWGLTLALAAGVLVGYHTYLADCVLLLPAILQGLQSRGLRLPAIALLTPVPWLLLHLPPPLPNVARALIVLFVIGMVVLRRTEGEPGKALLQRGAGTI